MLCLSMASDGTFDQNFEEPVIFPCDEIFIVTPIFFLFNLAVCVFVQR